MKKILLLLMIVGFSYSGSQATHLMGSELTAENIGGDDYLVTLTVYRDTLGIPMSLLQQLNVDSAGTPWASYTMDFDTSTGHLILGPYGIEVYTFTDTVTLAGPASYSLKWLHCCRNGAILNCANPLSESMMLKTTVATYGNSGSNSTPVFLAPPVAFVSHNMPWQYNPLPFDADGDSLVWMIDTPKTNGYVNVNGWVTPSADSLNPYSVDPVTGEVTWTPDMLGNFVTSFLVDEYRNGVRIGSMRRDMQMVVVPDSNNVPRIANFNTLFPQNANGHNFVQIPAENMFSVTMHGMDADQSDNVWMTAFGEPFLMTTNPATFQTSGSLQNNTVNGIFQWTPSASQARPQDYIVVFRIGDHQFIYDETVLVKVGLGTGISDANSNDFGNVFPNPADRNIFVPVTLSAASQIAVKIYDILGKRVSSFDAERYGKGSHLIGFNVDLTSGQYFMVIESNNEVVSTQKIIVNRAK